jgi:hypothetical protein
MKNKNVFLTAANKAITLWLSQNVQTTHTQFRILVHGHLFILPKPSEILEILKQAHVIIIDEMSMMINIMFCAMKQC